MAGVLMSIKVEPKAKAPAGHQQEEDRKADYIKRGENMLIEVVQSAVFGALTTGRIKPHEVIVIEGDHIGRYLVELELIEDEPTSDEEESEDAPEDVPGTDPQIVEEAVEEEAEDVSVEVVETPQKPKVESVTKVPYKKPEVYKYDTLKDARNPDGTPVLEVHKAYSLIRSGGMTARQVADKYGIRDARSVAQAIRQYRKRYHRGKEPDAAAILMATHRTPAKKQEGDGDEND